MWGWSFDEACQAIQSAFNPIDTSILNSKPRKSITDAFDEIELEKEQRKPYLITLWWGLNGLRLNEDGTSEWIRKMIPKTTDYIPPYIKTDPYILDAYRLMGGNNMIAQCCRDTEKLSIYLGKGIIG